MTIDVVFYFVKTVYYNQLSISYIIEEGFTFQSLYFGFQSTFGLYFATATPLFQELVLNEYDKIKAILGNELIACDDAKLHYHLHRAIEYIETRPPVRTLWRILPMDISLIKNFISAMITYILIIVSFKLT
ncbi:unnamed protein product [Colias eurytheme]|nr:unnamed protein product [Colias eurytheme]